MSTISFMHNFTRQWFLNGWNHVEIEIKSLVNSGYVFNIRQFQITIHEVRHVLKSKSCFNKVDMSFVYFRLSFLGRCREEK